jgi:hypothetical protein
MIVLTCADPRLNAAKILGFDAQLGELIGLSMNEQ